MMKEPGENPGPSQAGGKIRLEGAGKPGGCKFIRFSAVLEGDIIRSIRIRGDFFASPVEAFERAERRIPGISVKDLGPRFDALLAEEGAAVQGINGKGLAELIEKQLEKSS